MPEKGQHQSPVGVGEAISRIENYGLCEVLDRLFRLGHVVVGDALIYVGRGISGVEQDSLIEVVDGQVIMYADVVTDSMKRAIDETDRRRQMQQAYNKEHGITPQGIRKTVHDITERVKAIAETRPPYVVNGDIPKEDLRRLIKDLESQMKVASRNLEFEKAALLRDQIVDLRKVIADDILR